MTFAGFNRRMRKTARPVVWKGYGVQLPVPPSDQSNQAVGCSVAGGADPGFRADSRRAHRARLQPNRSRCSRGRRPRLQKAKCCAPLDPRRPREAPAGGRMDCGIESRNRGGGASPLP